MLLIKTKFVENVENNKQQRKYPQACLKFKMYNCVGEDRKQNRNL